MTSRGGHNKKQDVPRSANGKIDWRAIARAVREIELTERQKAMNRRTATQARERIFGLSKEKAVTQEAGSVFGRMYLQREITYRQFKAGEEFGKRHAAYLRAIQAPGRPRSGSAVDGPRGVNSSDGTDEVYVEACNTARRAFAELRRAALEADGFAMMALEHVVVDDRPTQSELTMGSLRAACNAMARLLKIEDKDRPKD